MLRGRWQRLALLFATAALALALAASLRVWRATEGGVRWALRHLPADPRCGHLLGQWAAIEQGAPPDCPSELLRGPRTAALLTALARDADGAVEARATALRVLVDAGRGPPRLAEAILAGPSTSPVMRRRALEMLASARGGIEWVERGRTVAIHGLHDTATLELFAAGEPGTTLAAMRALRAGGSPDPVYRGLGVSATELTTMAERHREGQRLRHAPIAWEAAFESPAPLLETLLWIEARARGEEPGPPAPPVGPANAALDALYASDGELADHAREEIAAVEGWIGAISGAAPTRIVAALLHPAAERVPPEVAPWEAGDVHAALRRGGGMPGATALLLEEAGAVAGVPIRLWTLDDGVVARIGSETYELRACEPPARTERARLDGREVPAGGGVALGLTEAVGRSLRVGDLEAAAAQLAVARRLWPGGPGLAAAEVAVRAARGAAPPASSLEGAPEASLEPSPEASPGAVAIDTVFVSKPAPPAPRRRRGRRPPAAVIARGGDARGGDARGGDARAGDARAGQRAAAAALAKALLAAAPDARSQAVAAYWAARSGHADLARALLPQPDGADDIRVAAAAMIGEPVGAVGPLSAGVLGVPWEGPAAGCGPFLDAGPGPR